MLMAKCCDRHHAKVLCFQGGMTVSNLNHHAEGIMHVGSYDDACISKSSCLSCRQQPLICGFRVDWKTILTDATLGCKNSANCRLQRYFAVGRQHPE